jgi:hypothetical protein
MIRLTWQPKKVCAEKECVEWKKDIWNKTSSQKLEVRHSAKESRFFLGHL